MLKKNNVIYIQRVDHDTAMRMNNLVTCGNMDKPHKQNVDWKKSEAKHYILYGYIYIKTPKEKLFCSVRSQNSGN